MMGSPLMLVLLVYLGANTQEVFGMPEFSSEVSKSLSNIKDQGEKMYSTLGQELIATADIFLRGLTDKYSALNDEMEKAIGEYEESSNDDTLDCSSSEALEMRSLKKRFDYCNNMTLELANLKNLSSDIIKAFQEIGVSTSVIVSDFYDCSQKPTSFFQASCIMQTMLGVQTSYSQRLPKFKFLYEKLMKCYSIIYSDMWQCFYSQNTYENSIPKIAHYSVKCN